MGFIYLIYEHINTLRIEHIHKGLMPVCPAPAGLYHNNYTPHTLRQVKVYHTVVDAISYIYQLAVVIVLRNMLYGGYSHYLILRKYKMSVHNDRAFLYGSCHVHVPLCYGKGAKVLVFVFFKQTIGLACGEVLVIQYPDFHIVLSTEIEYELNI